MRVILNIYLIIQYAVAGMVIAVVLLMLARLLLNYADLNPFGRPVMFVRRLSDPLVNPVRRALLQFGFGPNVAPLVTILLFILVGWFALMLTESLLDTAAGIVYSFSGQTRGALIAIFGYVLYGLLGLYSLLIFIRIIFSWGAISHHNPVMRFLANATDPLLLPLRRIIPTLGMFDISPIVAFIIIWLFQAAIAGTLLAGKPVHFIRAMLALG